MRCPHCATEHASTLVVCPQCGRPVAPEASAGPPSVSLLELDQHAAPTPGRGPDEPLPRTYLERPPLVAQADRFAPLDEAVAEVTRPPTRPAVVGKWQGQAAAPRGAGHRRLVLGGGAGLALIVGLVVAAALWLGRRAPEAPQYAAGPPAVVEPVAARSFDGVPWDNASLVVTLEVTPSTASIRFDGLPVVGKKVEVQRDGRTHTVVVSAPGYVTQAQAFVPVQTGRLRVELRRAGAR
jgi:hypothetical protein